MNALLLGVYTKCLPKFNEIASFTRAVNAVDALFNKKLKTALEKFGPFYDSSKHKLLYNVPEVGSLEFNGKHFDGIMLVNLGEEIPKADELEGRDQKLENIRCAIADGVKALIRHGGFEEIHIDPCDCPQCVAEVSILSVYQFDKLKKKRRQKVSLQLCNYPGISDNEKESWNKGVIIGKSQNFARTLMEKPGNLMTPTLFAQHVLDKCKDLKNVNILVRDENWIKEKQMNSFLSVSKGSDEKPVFVELQYRGDPNSDKNIALVGKGVTFDSGGISIKPSAEMSLMRGDMGGAACIAGAFNAVAQLQMKVNIHCFLPLCENMISGKATKPGDVVYAMNGKSIQVENTDAEGRLILADALCYAKTINPSLIVDLATLTGAMLVALGDAATGVFSNNTYYWEMIEKAGFNTGDRVWRFPLYKDYVKLVTDCHLADLLNHPGGDGGACVAAAFLREFVGEDVKWMHLDIASVMEYKEDSSYMCSGLTGRPTRTLVEFLRMVSEDVSR